MDFHKKISENSAHSPYYLRKNNQITLNIGETHFVEKVVNFDIVAKFFLPLPGAYLEPPLIVFQKKNSNRGILTPDY